MIAFSPASSFTVRLPTGKLNLIIHIRDRLDCIKEVNISSVDVGSDTKEINSLINTLKNSSNEIKNNSIVQLLASGDQNTVGQVITTISQEFNKMNNESFDKATSSK